MFETDFAKFTDDAPEGDDEEGFSMFDDDDNIGFSIDNTSESIFFEDDGDDLDDLDFDGGLSMGDDE